MSRNSNLPPLLLSIEDLEVWRGTKRVLSGLNLCLNRGDRTIITGPNGCGKTTLLKNIAHLIPHSSGSIDYTGKSIGWVPQEGVLNRFPIASEEVVMMGTIKQKLSRSARKKLIAQSMKLTDCFHLSKRCFHHLSGGEKQRVSLARCLCQQADLLLLDEPASYQDKENRQNLDRLLRSVQEATGAAILLVTHEKELFDQTEWNHLSLKGGQLVPGELP